MTMLLERAVETVRALPPEAQDVVARFLLQLTHEDEGAIPLTAEEEADLAAADEEVARGDFATDDEVAALWAKPRA
jgi:hypothetical protein